MIDGKSENNELMMKWKEMEKMIAEQQLLSVGIESSNR